MKKQSLSVFQKVAVLVFEFTVMTIVMGIITLFVDFEIKVTLKTLFGLFLIFLFGAYNWLMVIYYKFPFFNVITGLWLWGIIDRMGITFPYFPFGSTTLSSAYIIIPVLATCGAITSSTFRNLFFPPKKKTKPQT